MRGNAHPYREEVDVADGEQAEAVEAIGVAVGVEAAVVVVAAEVADLAEVAEGGGPGGLAEGMLELFERTGTKLNHGEPGGSVSENDTVCGTGMRVNPAISTDSQSLTES